MVDRIDIGTGPRLGFDPTDTGGFKYVGQKELTQKEYGSRKVNFYNEYLGLPGLGEESGIDVGAPEVDEDITPGRTDEGTDESEAVTNVLRDPTFTDGEATTGASSIKYGAEAYKPFTSEYATYSEYLRGAGKMDRVNLVSGIYEPLTKGNYRDIDLSVLGVEAREGVQAVRDAPQTLSEEFAELREEGFAGVKKKVAEGVPKAMAGIFAMSGLGTVGSLLTGDRVKNAFGATSFRPSGPLGVVSDLVHAKQYEDLAQIRAAESAASVYGPGDTFTYSDTGFAMQFGNGMGITRRPGARGYTGNLQGMSVNQIKDLEALTKGFIPKSYRFSGKAGLTDFGDFKANVSVEESGGVFTDPNNRLKGFYTAEGRYYTPGVGYSRYGNAADRNRLAESEFGWTTEAERERMQDIIEAARAGKGKLADLIQAEKNKIAADRAEQRRQQEAAAKAATAPTFGYQPSDDDGGGTISTPTGGGGSVQESFEDYMSRDYEDFASGGTVGMAAGGAMAAGMGSGFVDRPPSQVPEEQTVADDVETQMPEGAFVINAAAVEFAGEQDIKKMLNDAQKEAVRRGITIDNPENSTKLIDVAISRGEVTVAPYLAKIIGYDRLNKINNRGKPETKERLQEAAQGGMLGMAEGGVASPTRRPKREQLADIELRADLETFIQGDALARLGYKLYEDGHIRFNTAVDTEDYGVKTKFKAVYFPPGNVRTDKRGVIPIRDIAKMKTGRVLQEQGIASSQLKSDAGRVILAGNMFDAPKKKGSDTLYDASETTVDMISVAHEFRHAALDYLSKTYDLGLPTLKQEERIMDYADNQAIEKAGKVNPKLKERYFSNPDYKLMSERGKSAGDSAYLRKQYEQYTGLAEEILEAMDVPPQSPAIEKEGFLTRTYKSLVN